MTRMPDAQPPTSIAAEDPVRAGRAALDRHAWQEAFDLLSQAERERPLSGADLEALASAAFFTAQADLELEIKERAFAVYEAEGNTLRAAYLALDVARFYGWAGKFSIASAWTHRAERLIGPEGDTYAHGYLALVRSEAARAIGDTEGALALAERAVAIGDKAANADLKAYSLSNLGALKIASGDTAEGFAMMEEASIAAVNGELSPFTTGVTACQMIGACRDLTDYRRASEWIEATEKYCSRQSLSGFPGDLPHPSRRGGGRGRRLGARGAGARASDRRADRLQRDPAAGRRVLRHRRHPAPQGRLRGGRGGAARGSRTRPLTATGPRPDPPGGGQDEGGRLGHQRRGRRGDTRPLGAIPAAARPGGDRARGR